MSERSDIGSLNLFEVRGSRAFYTFWCIAAGALAWLSSVSWGWGLMGLAVFGAHSAWALVGLLNRRIRLRVTEDGIVDENFWWSPGLVPWEEMLDVRATKWGLVEIDLRDKSAFFERLSPLAQLVRVKQRLSGLGPALIVPWSLEGSKRDLLESLETGLDSSTVAAARLSVSS